jgi:hypothetical protein
LSIPLCREFFQLAGTINTQNINFLHKFENHRKLLPMRSLFLLLACLVSLQVYASHIFGGDITYKYLGNPTAGTVRYEVTITIYQDCEVGLPDAIAQDDPEFINFFDNAGNALFRDSYGNPLYDSIPKAFVSAIAIAPLCDTASNPAACLRKAVFRKIYDLPVLSTPGATYTVVVQRCCRTASVVNIDQSGSTGVTFYATIPADSKTNNAAIFKNDPVYYYRINTPLVYDASATDTDGDSLTYEFCTANLGGTNNDAKPIPLAPPYIATAYTASFSYDHPITSSPAIAIDPATGIISGTPTILGRYVLVVCCHEWRGGLNINTTRREMQFVITNCAPDTAGNDTTQKETYVYTSSFPSTTTISFAKGASNLAIVDILNGSIVYNSAVTENQHAVKISTGSWSKGIYVVRITYPGKGTSITKFALY